MVIRRARRAVVRVGRRFAGWWSVGCVLLLLWCAVGAWQAAADDPVEWAVLMVLLFLNGVFAVRFLAAKFDRESAERAGGAR